MHHPTGVLHERDAWAFPLPEPTPAEASRAVRDAIRDANAHGVVAVHDLEDARRPRDLAAAGRRPPADPRVSMGIPVAALGAARTIELRTGFGSEFLRVGPVKVFMDGTLGSPPPGC